MKGIKWGSGGVYVNYGAGAYAYIQNPEQWKDLGGGLLHIEDFPFETILKMDSVVSLQIRKGQE